jgi:hypothetical protein
MRVSDMTIEELRAAENELLNWFADGYDTRRATYKEHARELKRKQNDMDKIRKRLEALGAKRFG